MTEQSDVQRERTDSWNGCFRWWQRRRHRWDHSENTALRGPEPDFQRRRISNHPEVERNSFTALSTNIARCVYHTHKHHVVIPDSDKKAQYWTIFTNEDTSFCIFLYFEMARAFSHSMSEIIWDWTFSKKPMSICYSTLSVVEKAVRSHTRSRNELLQPRAFLKEK